jgi:hypothetical protein
MPASNLKGFKLMDMYLEVPNPSAVSIPLVRPHVPDFCDLRVRLSAVNASALHYIDNHPENQARLNENGLDMALVQLRVGVISVLRLRVVYSTAIQSWASDVFVIVGSSSRHLWCALWSLAGHETTKEVYALWESKHAANNQLRDRASRALPSGHMLYAAIKRRKDIFSLHISLLEGRAKLQIT